MANKDTIRSYTFKNDKGKEPLEIDLPMSEGIMLKILEEINLNLSRLVEQR
jgi:hypothetical protein